MSCSPNLLSLCISVMWSDWSMSVFTPSTWTVAICGRLGNGVRQGAPASLGGTCVELLRLVGELGLLRRHKNGSPPQKTGGKINMDSWLTSAPVISAVFLNQAVLGSLSHWSHLLLQAEALSPSRVWNLNASRRSGFSAVDQTFTYTHQWDTPTPVTPLPHTCNGRERLPSDEPLSPWEVKLDSDSGLNWFRMTK